MTVEDAAGNTEGVGTLQFNYSATSPTMQWTPPGGSAGSAVKLTESSKYAIQGAANGGLVFVNVTVSSLPSSNQTNSITIANQKNKIWDNVSKPESLAGDTEYRCRYLKNTHTTDTMIDVRLWRDKDTDGQDVLTVDIDPAAIGDGTSTGVATACLQAAKTITAASWSASVATYTSTAHGYAVGDLVKVAGITPSGYNVTAGLITTIAANTFTIAVTSDPGAYSSGGTAQRYEEGTAPSGVAFSSSPISEATALVIGDIGPGLAKAFWERRVVPAQTSEETPNNTSRLGIRAYI